MIVGLPIIFNHISTLHFLFKRKL